MRNVFAVTAALALLSLGGTACWALDVEYLKGNATLVLAPGFIEPGWPGAPASLAGRTILEWRDGAPGLARDVWTEQGQVHNFVNTGYGDGPCLDQAGATCTTTTTVASNAVAFVIGSDWNDGRGQLYVDNVLVAQLNWPTPTWTNYALVVDGLSYATHTLEVRSLQPYVTNLTSAVFVYGGAAVTPVPEPSTLLALLCAIGGLGGLTRLRYKR